MMRGVILFGHGSRDAQWRKPIDAVAARIAERDPGAKVRCAFLELETPDLATAASELAAAGVSTIAVLPMFLGSGRHAREDLPRLVEAARASWPAVTFDLRTPVGEDLRLVDLLATLALE